MTEPRLSPWICDQCAHSSCAPPAACVLALYGKSRVLPTIVLLCFMTQCMAAGRGLHSTLAC